MKSAESYRPVPAMAADESCPEVDDVAYMPGVTTQGENVSRDTDELSNVRV